MPWALALAVIAGGLFLMTARKDVNPDAEAPWRPRGIRNNNPGNIERTGTKWQGMAPQQTDSRFIVFESPHWGIRALARTLRTYRNSYGLNTVRGMINRWAPPVENNTDSYVRSVAAAVGVSPDQPLAFDAGQLRRLVAAIIQHENGEQPYSDSQLDDGIQAGWA